MHKRSGSLVKGHYRNGSWVDEHYRSETVVDDGLFIPNYVHQYKDNKKTYDNHSWLYNGSITFFTSCWWCGDDVYFHRNENGGCVLFDELGVPWPVHSCWNENKHEQHDVLLIILDNYKKKLRKIRIEDYQYANKSNLLHKDGVDAFLIGSDLSKRVILNKDTPHLKEIYFRYVVYSIIGFGVIKVLVPEDSLEGILTKVQVSLIVSTYKRGAYDIDFIKKIYIKSPNVENLIKSMIDPNHYLQYSWIYQSNLTD